jgi:hypothetical protein
MCFVFELVLGGSGGRVGVAEDVYIRFLNEADDFGIDGMRSGVQRS